MKDFTLGQYYPGNSLMHRLDPRLKILGMLFYVVLVFVAQSFAGIALMFCWMALLAYIARVPLRLLLGSLKSIYFLLLFTFVLNAFWYPGGTTLFELWFLRMSSEGLVRAVFLALRLVLMITGTSLLTITTTPISLTDGMESLMRPLSRFGFPAHEMAMMMTLALRFIPTLMEETDRIRRAQASRGAAFDRGGLIKRAKAIIPLIVPLFVSAFRRAEDLALAMEARCYHGADGRTRLHPLKWTKKDTGALLVLLLLTALIIAEAFLAPRFFPGLMSR